MKRLHLIEIHDQSWCPRVIRDSLTDHLQFSLAITKPYKVMVPVLTRALERTGARQIVDLCSGGGGPWAWLLPAMVENGLNVSVCLTDKYPNQDAAGRAGIPSPHALRYHSQPVDATRVPGELAGFRTVFTAFHHLRPEEARAVLADAVQQHQGIAVFEVVHRNPLALGFALLFPLMMFFTTPFIRPFRWSRLLWTYLIPLVPFVAFVDALVSCLRAYTITELRGLIQTLKTTDYDWEVGTAQTSAATVPVTYLIGVPQGDSAFASVSRPVADSDLRIRESAS